MYDTTRPKTFDHIGNWLEEIEINRPATQTKANLVIAIVGTKSDAEGSERRAGDSIQIDVSGRCAWIDLFLKFHQGITYPHFTVSTKIGDGLEEMFEAIMVMTLQKMGIRLPKNQTGIVKLRRGSNVDIAPTTIQPNTQTFPGTHRIVCVFKSR